MHTSKTFPSISEHKIAHHIHDESGTKKMLPHDEELSENNAITTTLRGKRGEPSYSLTSRNSFVGVLRYLHANHAGTTLYTDVKAIDKKRQEEGTLENYINNVKIELAENNFEVLGHRKESFKYALSNGKVKDCHYDILKIRDRETGNLTHYVKYPDIEDKMQDTAELFAFKKHLGGVLKGQKFDNITEGCWKGMSRSASLLLADMVENGAKNKHEFKDIAGNFLKFWEARMKKTGRYDENTYIRMPARETRNYDLNGAEVYHPVGTSKPQLYSSKRVVEADPNNYRSSIIQLTSSWLNSLKDKSKGYNISQMCKFFEENTSGEGKVTRETFLSTVDTTMEFYLKAYIENAKQSGHDLSETKNTVAKLEREFNLAAKDLGVNMQCLKGAKQMLGMEASAAQNLGQNMQRATLIPNPLQTANIGNFTENSKNRGALSHNSANQAAGNPPLRHSVASVSQSSRLVR